VIQYIEEIFLETGPFCKKKMYIVFSINETLIIRF